ncbi:hypothetical protein PoB_005372200 [Plakobranchus ocellatus]|uniref:Uncharacterized protein n=1 Tax=Plakobranchus ocellatus TaxID=259542 RepID=A0AAV4C765_9GAST|nr:hypothetical protein PoB_005372200 [Plakobranchus ocellatus]
MRILQTIIIKVVTGEEVERGSYDDGYVIWSKDVGDVNTAVVASDEYDDVNNTIHYSVNDENNDGANNSAGAGNDDNHDHNNGDDVDNDHDGGDADDDDDVDFNINIRNVDGDMKLGKVPRLEQILAIMSLTLTCSQLTL